jgi:hypothetical protein
MGERVVVGVFALFAGSGFLQNAPSRPAVGLVVALSAVGATVWVHRRAVPPGGRVERVARRSALASCIVFFVALVAAIVAAIVA